VVLAGGDQQLAGDIGADAVGGDQARVDGGDQRASSSSRSAISVVSCWWRRARERRAILAAVAGVAASTRSGRKFAQVAISCLTARPRSRARRSSGAVTIKALI
jgi:hypothetical protein